MYIAKPLLPKYYIKLSCGQLGVSITLVSYLSVFCNLIYAGVFWEKYSSLRRDISHSSVMLDKNVMLRTEFNEFSNEL